MSLSLEPVNFLLRKHKIYIWELVSGFNDTGDFVLCHEFFNGFVSSPLACTLESWNVRRQDSFFQVIFTEFFRIEIILSSCTREKHRARQAFFSTVQLVGSKQIVDLFRTGVNLNFLFLLRFGCFCGRCGFATEGKSLKSSRPSSGKHCLKEQIGRAHV